MKHYIILFTAAFALCSCNDDTDAVADGIQFDTTASPHVEATHAERRQQTAAETEYYMQRHDSRDEGYAEVRHYMACGDTLLTAYRPQGQLTVSGLFARTRNGKGLLRDHHGRLIIGTFRNDSLVSGLRFDSLGIYAGQMNYRGEACGEGMYHAFDDSYFAGTWSHDQREGLGITVSPTLVTAGRWHYGLYRGERIAFHSDRVYGIDISRHQHEKRRRKLPFSWQNLRIKHLGHRIDNEQIIGSVDYPVSFVYIKSTEGVTIQNRYFADDYLSARRKNIRAGAYHFFSTRTPASEQAEHFIRHTRFSRGDMPPMLDIEPSDQQIAAMGGPLVLLSEMRVWLQAVEQAVGTRPIIYVNLHFINNFLPLAPDLNEQYTFWIACYRTEKPGLHMALWQCCDDGRVQGITGDVDINVFNGYEHNWQDFLRDATIK